MAKKSFLVVPKTQQFRRRRGISELFLVLYHLPATTVKIFLVYRCAVFPLSQVFALATCGSSASLQYGQLLVSLASLHAVSMVDVMLNSRFYHARYVAFFYVSGGIFVNSGADVALSARSTPSSNSMGLYIGGSCFFVDAWVTIISTCVGVVLLLSSSTHVLPSSAYRMLTVSPYFFFLPHPLHLPSFFYQEQVDAAVEIDVLNINNVLAFLVHGGPEFHPTHPTHTRTSE